MLLLSALLLLALTGCQRSSRQPSDSRAATASAKRTDAPLTLDTVFQSPSGLYSIRANQTWPVRQLPNLNGTVDYFMLPNATLSIVTGALQPGTTLETYVQQTEASYQKLNLQGVQAAGSVDVGGGQGELLRAVTYVTANGQTVATPPSAGAAPHVFYEALYVAGGHSFAFSMAWPKSGSTDFLTLFRAILHTFTLAGAS